MTHVIFVGPSLPADDVRALHPEAILYPPVRQGDIAAVLREHRPSAIGIIDGVYLDVLSVWHKEILSALHQGVAVYGAASMGALRAVECAPFGMVGVGRIFELFMAGELTRDDEVAVAHATSEFGYRTLSEPLVNIRLNLAAAVTAGALDADLAAALLDEVAALYFPERSWHGVLSSSLLTPAQSAELAEFLGTNAIDYKAADARAMVAQLASAAGRADSPDHGWDMERTHYLAALEQRDVWYRRQGEDIAVESISRYLLANDPQAPDRARTALLELVVSYTSSKLGIEPTAADIAATRAHFTAEQGLHTETQVARFRERNDLTEAEFDELMAQQARVEKVLDWVLLSRFKLGVTKPMLDQYRLRDEYAHWADQAVFAQQVNGSGADGASTRIELPELPVREQVARHQRATGWNPGALDLTAWTKKYGFIHPDALLMEFERSRRARALLLAAGEAARGVSAQNVGSVAAGDEDVT